MDAAHIVCVVDIVPGYPLCLVLLLDEEKKKKNISVKKRFLS